MLDASVAVAWVNSEERTSAVAAIFNRLTREFAWVPSLWRLEVANALQMSVRRKRFAIADRDEHLADLRKFVVHTDDATAENAWTRTLALSDRHNLTVYDAAYLELALRRALPLASLDRELRAAAASENVALLGL